MAEINKYADSAQPFLPAGSHVRHSLLCQAAPAPWYFVVNYLTYLTIFWIKFRIICVTDDAIYVLRGSKFDIKPQELIATLPRATRLGPVSGRWSRIQLLGETHYVHQRFFPDVTAADSEIP